MNAIEEMKFSPEVSAAIKKMDKSTPKSPDALVRSLGAQLDSDTERLDVPSFRGWIGSLGLYTKWHLETFGVPSDIDVSDIQYIAFWKARASEKTIFWVSLPSMASGEVENGGAVVPGDERVRIGSHTQEELDTMIRQGHETITKMVAERREVA